MVLSLKRILLALFLAAGLCSAKEIVIGDFEGLFTNADLEDIKAEQATVLKNFEPHNGRLRKTFALGDRLSANLTASGYTVYGMFTWIQDSLSLDTVAATDGQLYMGYLVNDTTNKVALRFWKGTVWLAQTAVFKNTLPTVYHKEDYNPIIQDGGIVRSLPGNVGLADGSNESKGLWMGYIDREYFEQTYDPAAGFYIYTAPLEAPDLSSSGLDIEVDTIFFAGIDRTAGTYYYKLAYIYDGIQESPTSELFGAVLTESSSVELSFTINKSTWNKRITGMNVYRSNSPDSIGGYSKIGVIDFTRDVTNFESGLDGAYNLKERIYFTDATGWNFSMWTSQWFFIRTSNVIKRTPTPDMTGTGNKMFISYDPINGSAFNENYEVWGVNSGETAISRKFSRTVGCYGGDRVIYLPDYSYDENSLTGSYFLYYDDIKPTIGIITRNKDNAIEISGRMSSASRTGNRQWKILRPRDGTYFTDTLTTSKFEITTIKGADSLQGTYFVLPSPDTSYLVWWDTTASGSTPDSLYDYDSSNILIRVWQDTGFTDVQIGSILAYALNSLDDFTASNIGSLVTIDCDSTGITTEIFEGDSLQTNFTLRTLVIGGGSSSVVYTFYEPGLSQGAQYPLDGEPSQKINGQYAMMASNRLFLGNIVLDPGGFNEVHTDWLAYSELDQPDVMPASNVIPVNDREGGPITGVAEMFGNVVIMKRFAINILNVKDYPDDPTRWRFIQSIHNIGNIADRGYLSVQGRLYVIAVDGIYMLSPNSAAETDMTPTENLRISDPINDVFDALTYAQKQAIISEYNQYTGEAWFYMNDDIYAVDLVTGAWRQIETSIVPSIMTVDEKAYILAFSSADSQTYSNSVQATVGASWKSKTFPISDERNEVIRDLYLTYQSPVCSLRFLSYLNNETTPSDTIVFDTSRVIQTVKQHIGEVARKYSFGIETIGTSAADTVNIYQVRILHE